MILVGAVCHYGPLPVVGGVNADFMIGSGLVDEILTAYVSFEHLGLAPNFRKAVEKKTTKM